MAFRNRNYLDTFLILHCPYGHNAISRVGKPVWYDEDFKKLITDLQYRGYGWLQPEGVRKKLEEMTRNWQGPPPLPWEVSIPQQNNSNKGNGVSIEHKSVNQSEATPQKPWPIEEPNKLLNELSSVPKPCDTVNIETCPRCGSSDKYKSFGLGGRIVHKCLNCKFSDYQSPNAIELKQQGSSEISPNKNCSEPIACEKKPSFASPSVGVGSIDRDLVCQIIKGAGDEKKVFRNFLFDWGVGHGSPEAKRVYEQYVKALPKGVVPPDMKSFVKELLQMKDPINMRLRDKKPHESPKMVNQSGQTNSSGSLVCPCGTSNSSNNIFCTSCGKKLQSGNIAPVSNIDKQENNKNDKSSGDGLFSRLFKKTMQNPASVKESQKPNTIRKPPAIMGRSLGPSRECGTVCLNCNRPVVILMPSAPIPGKVAQIVMKHTCVHCKSDLYTMSTLDNKLLLGTSCRLLGNQIQLGRAVELEIWEGANLAEHNGALLKAIPLVVGKGPNGQPALLSAEDLGLNLT
jgi:hypothetical protein